MKNKLSKRKKGVVLEDIDAKLNVLIEGQSGLAAGAHKTDIRLGNLENKADALVNKFGSMHSEMNKGFEEVDYKFEAVFEQLHLIRNEKISRDEFVALEKRLVAVEKKLIGRR